LDLSLQHLLVECGVDWLTCTAHSGVRARAMASSGGRWLDEREAEGYIVRPWNWNGYRGRVVDGCSYGSRDDGSIVRLSGSMAIRHFLSAMVMADQVSRLDIQVTVLDRIGQADWARIAFGTVQELPLVQSGMVGTKYTVSTPEGATFNLGSRSSERYLRLYDKTAETKGEYPIRCWRYEIEYKGQRANSNARRIHTARSTDCAVYDAIKNCYGAYGVTVPCSPPGRGWMDAGYRHTTDDERRLLWLATSIRPCVIRLIEAYNAETIAAALGFTVNPDHTDMFGYSFDPIACDARA
jgi:hypothetical protein